MKANEEAEGHFEKMSEVMNSIPKHRLILECGDFNAHLGKDDVAHSFHEEKNSNGELLIDHLNECDLKVTNTLFKKRRGKQWTYLSDMNGSKTQIDYILINKKWRNSVHNVEAYSNLSSIGSDHRLVTAKLKLSLRMTKPPRKKKLYDWSVLKDEKLQNEYSIEVKNLFDTLSNDV